MCTRAPERRSRLSARSQPRLAGLVVLLLSATALSPLLGCEAQERPEPAAAQTEPAERVASLSRVATRLVLELSAEDRIVAVDADSATLPGLERRQRIPVSEPEALRMLIGLGVDLVLLPVARIELSTQLNAANIRTIVVLVRDFDEGLTLWGELAGRLGLTSAARARIEAANRAITDVAAAGPDGPRPRVAVVESFEPLVLAAGRTLANDLVRIAGGEPVTADRPEERLPVDLAELAALRPALLVHPFSAPLGPASRDRLAQQVARVAPLVFVELDPERFFEAGTAEAARALQAALTRLEAPQAFQTSGIAE